MTNVVLFFDGGVRKLRVDGEVVGYVGAGAAVIYRRVEEVGARARYLKGRSLTSNVCEYEGLLLGLDMAYDLGATDVRVYGDSELVVRQVRGDYRCRKEHLLPLRDRAWESGARFESIAIMETPRGRRGRRRDNNSRADELANDAMDLRCHIYRDEITLHG